MAYVWSLAFSGMGLKFSSVVKNLVVANLSSAGELGTLISKNALLPKVSPNMLWARYCSCTMWQGMIVQY
jgi:hypothetical protein